MEYNKVFYCGVEEKVNNDKFTFCGIPEKTEYNDKETTLEILKQMKELKEVLGELKGDVKHIERKVFGQLIPGSS